MSVKDLIYILIIRGTTNSIYLDATLSNDNIYRDKPSKEYAYWCANQIYSNIHKLDNINSMYLGLANTNTKERIVSANFEMKQIPCSYEVKPFKMIKKTCEDFYNDKIAPYMETQMKSNKRKLPDVNEAPTNKKQKISNPFGSESSLGLTFSKKLP